MRTIICRFDNIKNLLELQKELPLLSDARVYDLDEKVTIKYFRKKANKKFSKKEIYYGNMPQFKSKKIEAYRTIDFVTNKSNEELEHIFKQSITSKTKSIWYPKADSGWYSSYRVLGKRGQGQFPIYIVSKGRPNIKGTSYFLTNMEVFHHIIVEEEEFHDYYKYINHKFTKLLILPKKYKEEYDCFWKDEDKRTGPGPARNFAWNHSIEQGFEWHWVMDDNANEGFHWIYQNTKIKIRTGLFLKACEDFTLNADNIAIAGLNYTKFVKSTDCVPPYVVNTRIYSFLLINNSIPYRWRGRYNEDTDLSLRVLKDGWNTIQYNVFTAGKATTQNFRGGNTDEFYEQEGTYLKSKMLKDMHPEDVELVTKFNRWHHYINYKKFHRDLLFKNIVNTENNYGMYIVNTKETDTGDSLSYLLNKYPNDNEELPIFYTY